MSSFINYYNTMSWLILVAMSFNTHIPCPSLGGVTPEDVHVGRASEKKLRMETYRNQERIRMKEKTDPGELVDRKEVPKIVRDLVDVSRMPGDELSVLSLLLGGKPVRLFNPFRPEGVG
jgi:hypothetical protein